MAPYKRQQSPMNLLQGDDNNIGSTSPQYLRGDMAHDAALPRRDILLCQIDARQAQIKIHISITNS